ncbi:MAG: nucleoside triphosphate pyrophosphohydrolase family protein [Dolichospermum sp.]|jgi:NTP pyrophosphatase (non-canonical NTP hydrolase)
MTYPKMCKITPEEYQDAILEISKQYPIWGSDKALPTYSLGLGEEAGEVLGLLKRHFRGDESVTGPEFKVKLTRELGDVTAYLVLVGHCFGIDFEDVLTANIDKLKDRLARNSHIGAGDDR